MMKHTREDRRRSSLSLSLSTAAATLDDDGRREEAPVSFPPPLLDLRAHKLKQRVQTSGHDRLRIVRAGGICLNQGWGRCDFLVIGMKISHVVLWWSLLAVKQLWWNLKYYQIPR